MEEVVHFEIHVSLDFHCAVDSQKGACEFVGLDGIPQRERLGSVRRSPARVFGDLSGWLVGRKFRRQKSDTRNPTSGGFGGSRTM